jgi:hypothetical protein
MAVDLTLIPISWALTVWDEETTSYKVRGRIDFAIFEGRYVYRVTLEGGTNLYGTFSTLKLARKAAARVLSKQYRVAKAVAWDRRQQDIEVLAVRWRQVAGQDGEDSAWNWLGAELEKWPESERVRLHAQTRAAIYARKRTEKRAAEMREEARAASEVQMVTFKTAEDAHGKPHEAAVDAVNAVEEPTDG